MSKLINTYKNKTTGHVVESIWLVNNKESICVAIEWVNHVDMSTSYFGELACITAVRNAGKLKLNVDKDQSLQCYALLGQHIIQDKEGLFSALDPDTFLSEYEVYDGELEPSLETLSLPEQFPVLRILQELNTIEKENNITILFAVESGSRAWGYDSPTSDFDIKFVYVQKTLESTLSIAISPKSDVISHKTEDGLMEISGWRLDKFMNLLSKSNTSPLEWIKSPIVYRDWYSLLNRLNSEVMNFFDQRHTGWQYYRSAKDAYDKFIRLDKQPSAKRYIQVLRFLLSTYYVLDINEPVPLSLKTLTDPISGADPEFLENVNELLELKRTGEDCSSSIQRYFGIYFDEKLLEKDKYLPDIETRLMKMKKSGLDEPQQLATRLYLEILSKVYDL